MVLGQTGVSGFEEVVQGWVRRLFPGGLQEVKDGLKVVTVPDGQGVKGPFERGERGRVELFMNG